MANAMPAVTVAALFIIGMLLVASGLTMTGLAFDNGGEPGAVSLAANGQATIVGGVLCFMLAGIGGLWPVFRPRPSAPAGTGDST